MICVKYNSNRRKQKSKKFNFKDELFSKMTNHLFLESFNLEQKLYSRAPRGMGWDEKNHPMG